MRQLWRRWVSILLLMMAIQGVGGRTWAWDGQTPSPPEGHGLLSEGAVLSGLPWLSSEGGGRRLQGLLHPVSSEQYGISRALSPEEKAWLKEKYRQWKSLPPEKRKALKRKLERWKRLSPEDRALFRRRFQQWKRLSPSEKKILREKLKRWKDLSPQEREAIRRRFLQGY